MRASLSCVETSFFEALRLDIRRGESESGSRRDGEFTRSRGFNKSNPKYHDGSEYTVVSRWVSYYDGKLPTPEVRIKTFEGVVTGVLPRLTHRTRLSRRVPPRSSHVALPRKVVDTANGNTYNAELQRARSGGKRKDNPNADPCD